MPEGHIPNPLLTVSLWNRLYQKMWHKDLHYIHFYYIISYSVSWGMLWLNRLPMNVHILNKISNSEFTRYAEKVTEKTRFPSLPTSAQMVLGLLGVTLALSACRHPRLRTRPLWIWPTGIHPHSCGCPLDDKASKTWFPALLPRTCGIWGKFLIPIQCMRKKRG